MRILLSNDDGYFAPGLERLAAELAPHADITVVAPERDRSGASNSLTLDRPLTVRRAPNGFLFVNGTPTDCVHLAVTGLLDDLPEMVITRIGRRHKAESVIKTETPRGETCYWVGAAGPAADAGEGTDFHAIDAGYVSVTPLQIDLTHR